MCVCVTLLATHTHKHTQGKYNNNKTEPISSREGKTEGLQKRVVGRGQREESRVESDVILLQVEISKIT